MKKGTATKGASRAVKSSGGVERLDVNKNTTASIRAIENGFIVSESGYKGKGRNMQYVSKEYFSPTNPVAGIKFGGKRK